jgi:hypothetical protein
MAKAASSSPTAQSTKISLNDVATRYLDALQRIYDLVSYSLAASRRINEHDYDEFSQQLQVMPRQQSRMDFEKAKDAAEHWFLRNSLGDAVALIGPLMEDCRTISSLCTYKTSGQADPAKLQAIVGEERQKFMLLPAKEKFRVLKEEYSLTSPVQEHIEGLLEATKCLIWKNGVVTAEEANADGKLKFKIRSIHVVPVSGGVTKANEHTLNLTRRMGDSEKVFAVGETINLSKAEHVGAIITVGLFIGSLLQGLQEFARKTGAADDQPAA